MYTIALAIIPFFYFCFIRKRLSLQKVTNITATLCVIVLVPGLYAQNKDFFTIKADTIICVKTGSEAGTLAYGGNDLPVSLNKTYAYSPNRKYLAFVGHSSKGNDLFLSLPYNTVLIITENSTIDWTTSYMGSGISWSPDSSSFVISIQVTLYIYRISSRTLKALYKEPGYSMIKARFVDNSTVHFFRGTIVHYSFSGEEYSILTNGTHLKKTGNNSVYIGEDLKGE